mgnify:CR=1 FL=1
MGLDFIDLPWVCQPPCFYFKMSLFECEYFFATLFTPFILLDEIEGNFRLKIC